MIAKGLYRHINRYGNIRVLGMARCNNNPSKKVVVYKQLYSDIVKEPTPSSSLQHFPYGTLFVQDSSNFEKFFEKLEEDSCARFQ